MAWYRPKFKVFEAVRVVSLVRGCLGPACFSEYPDWLREAFDKELAKFAYVHPGADGVAVSVQNCFGTRGPYQLRVGDWIVCRGGRGVQPVRAATFRARFEECG